MAGGLSQSVHRAVKCSIGGYGVGPNHLMRKAHKAWGSKTRSEATAASNKAAKTLARSIAAGVARR